MLAVYAYACNAYLFKFYKLYFQFAELLRRYSTTSSMDTDHLSSLNFYLAALWIITR